MAKGDKKIISYLTFKLGEELFAFNVGSLLNIHGMIKITNVPKSPPYMRGVINLRGEVLPVIDTKIKLGMGKTEITNDTCILVIEINIDKQEMKVGVMVDAVMEVLEFKDEDIKEPPSLGSSGYIDFITGLVEYDENFIMIMAIDKMLEQEIIEVRNMSIRGEFIDEYPEQKTLVEQ